jgi:hypothetical protein
MMNKLMLLAVVVVLSLSVCLQAHAAVIDFESLWPGSETEGLVPDGYAGFDWDAGALNASWKTKNHRPGTGYQNTINGNVGIYTPYAASIGLQNGGIFDLTSIRMGAAWNDDQYAYVDGYLGAAHPYTAHILTPWLGQDFVFNWAGIDKLVITPDDQTGTLHPGMVGAGHHVVMDDFVLNKNGPGNGSPELSTWMLLACSGLAGLVLRRRRKA